MAKRPAGVTFLAVFYFLASALMVLPAGFFLYLALFPELFLGFGMELPSFSNPVAQLIMWFLDQLPEVFPTWLTFPLLFVALAAGYAAIGLGLWRVRKWARIVALAFAGAEFVSLAVSFYMLSPLPSDPYFVRVDVIHIPVAIIDLWTLWYLFRPRISQAFGV